MEKNKKSMDAMQAKEQIRQYFGKHLRDVNIVIAPNNASHGLYMTFIEITYKNFKPIREVRKDIEAMFDRPILTLNRYYTPKVLRKALWHMKQEFPDMEESMLNDEEFLFEVDAWLYARRFEHKRKSCTFATKIAMKKAYKYKLNPTFKQKNLLSQFFGCARFIYNWGLNRKESFYKETKENLSYVMLTKELTALKKQEETKWLSECANECLQYSLRNLDTAYSNFFHKRAEHPKYKSKKKSKDVCKFISCVHFDFEKWKVKIPKVGWTKLCLNRTFDTDKCKIGTLTVSRDRCGTYWCTIVVEDHEQPKPKAKVSESTAVGIDLGIKTYATLSDGTKYSNPKHYERALKLLAVRQRKFARTQKDSKRHEAMRLKVARLMRRIANKRQDYLHKMSAELVKKHDTIFLEDLKVQDMQKNDKLSMHIQSASWSEFARQLSYKSEWQGKNVVFIGGYEPSSQTCSECGYRNEETKDLSVRKWVCPKCGALHDRDVNAARNILRFGLKKSEAS